MPSALQLLLQAQRLLADARDVSAERSVRSERIRLAEAKLAEAQSQVTVDGALFEDCVDTCIVVAYQKISFIAEQPRLQAHDVQEIESLIKQATSALSYSAGESVSFPQEIERILPSLTTTPTGLDLLLKISSPSFTPRIHIPSDDFDRARLSAILYYLESKYISATQLCESGEWLRAYDVLQSMKAAKNSALDLETYLEKTSFMQLDGVKARGIKLRADFDALLVQCRARVVDTSAEKMPDSPVASDARLDWVQPKPLDIFGSLNDLLSRF